MKNNRIAVIGAGAAGMMAAGTAAEYGHAVTLFERNPAPGRKLLITGKGRCNVCNRAAVSDLVKNTPVNGSFLYGAFSRFDAEDVIAFFEERGVPLKTERGNRVFPQSDRSADIVRALVKYCEEGGVELRYGRVTHIEPCAGGFLVTAGGKQEEFSQVVLATGGKSYPKTGSTGDGYHFARALGHTVTPLKPSLVPLCVEETELCQRMQGVALKNVALTIQDESGKEVCRDFGEMLFTHFGVSGPMVLSASSLIRDFNNRRYTLHIDLKPALPAGELDRRLQRDFLKYAKKDFIHALDDLVPRKMTEPLVDLTGIEPHKKISEVTREERLRVGALLKDLCLTITGPRPIDEAIITSGGVKTSEINPKTMESKLVPGLFFAGEIMDVDAYTGGFNLQIAFSTGRLCGQNL